MDNTDALFADDVERNVSNALALFRASWIVLGSYEACCHFRPVWHHGTSGLHQHGTARKAAPPQTRFLAGSCVAVRFSSGGTGPVDRPTLAEIGRTKRAGPNRTKPRLRLPLAHSAALVFSPLGAPHRPRTRSPKAALATNRRAVLPHGALQPTGQRAIQDAGPGSLPLPKLAHEAPVGLARVVTAKVTPIGQRSAFVSRI